MLSRSLGGEKEAEHIDVELFMEVILGDGLKRRALVDPRVVNEDVEAAVSLDCGVDDALRICSLGNVASHRDGLAAMVCDMGDDGVGARLARCIMF
jgi:hypothetical protein